ncbi:MAG TPA: hypothetical protein VFS52_12545 [Steroidobacteraceae bacterium]|nr:hypothetical protein [Steroidobacteraceae bacterium]
MIITEELLMAYADGELAGPEHAADRTRIEAALRADPQIARRIESHRALRRELSASFDRVLDEPVPARLAGAVRRALASSGADASADTDGRARDGAEGARGSIDATGGTEAAPHSFGARGSGGSSPRSAGDGTSAANPEAQHTAQPADSGGAGARAGWDWQQWGAMGASLVVGIVLGRAAVTSRDLGPIASRDGHLIAQGHLADALSNQLASTQSATAPVQIGTSFKSKDGSYCRTFVLHEADPMGGLACRAGGEWTLNTLARVQASPGAKGRHRPAASQLPGAVRAAVEAQIVGDPLDSSAEAQAKDGGWK